MIVNKGLLRRLQLTEYEMLLEVDRICRKNGIMYFLCYGTLLGAVRHKGFIPWDDDLDIGMTRDHYDTFLKVVKDELNDMYYCLEWNSYSDYSIPYAKIKKKNTLFRERKGGSSKYNEVFIDIFPFDNVEGRGIRAAIDALLLYSIRNTLMIKAGMTPWKGEGIASRMKYYPFRMLNLITERESLKRKYDCISRKNNDIETGWIAPRSIDGTEIKQKIKKYIIGNPKQIQFENAYFYCPEHSDAFLTETYGEYRELPPEDKRSPRHEGVEIVL